MPFRFLTEKADDSAFAEGAGNPHIGDFPGVDLFLKKAELFLPGQRHQGLKQFHNAIIKRVVLQLFDPGFENLLFPGRIQDVHVVRLFVQGNIS